MDSIDRMQQAEELLMRSAIDRAVADPAPAGRACHPGSGRCEGCGRPVPPKRLRALPGAQTCIACQRELEGGRPG